MFHNTWNFPQKTQKKSLDIKSTLAPVCNMYASSWFSSEMHEQQILIYSACTLGGHQGNPSIWLLANLEPTPALKRSGTQIIKKTQITKKCRIST